MYSGERWCSASWGEDDIKSPNVVWSCQKTNRRSGEKKMDQMENKSTKRGIGRLKKTLGEPLNNIYLKGFPETSVFDKAQWHHLMHVADPT